MKPDTAQPNLSHESLAAISDSYSGNLNKANSVDALFESANNWDWKKTQPNNGDGVH